MYRKDSHPSRSNFIGVFFVFLGAIAFSSKSVVGKLAFGSGIDPVTLLTLRMLSALPFYLIILFSSFRKTKDSINFKSKDLIMTALTGLIGYYISSILDFYGLALISASLERLVLFVYPTIVVVLSAIFLKKKINGKGYIALILTYLGVAIAYLGDVSSNSQNTILGVIYVLGAALTYAIFLMMSGEIIPRMGVRLFTSIYMLSACVGILIHYSIDSSTKILTTLSNEVIYYGIYLGIFATVVPSLLVSEGVRRIGSSRSAIVASIGPIATLFLSNLLLGEELGITEFVGVVFVLSGVFLVAKEEPRPLAKLND
jgi:drug/metabolite transporter (DMT)-like permease